MAIIFLGLIGLTVWSMIALPFVMVALLPALFGFWRVAVSLCLALALVWLGLLLGYLGGMRWPLPLPSRPSAVPYLLPLMAFWPALAALLIIRFRLNATGAD